MKKLVLVVAMLALFASVGFSARGDNDLVFKVGADVAGNLNIDGEISSQHGGVVSINGFKENYSVDNGITLGLEYLYSSSNIFKLGFGIQYLPKRDVKHPGIKDTMGKNMEFSAVPIYVTVQLYPVKAASNLYIKGNLGFSIVTLKPSVDTVASSSLRDPEMFFDPISRTAGVYAGIGAGYEFPFGLIIELIYDLHKVDNRNPHMRRDGVWPYYLVNSYESDITYTYTNLGINVGYKFKL